MNAIVCNSQILFAVILDSCIFIKLNYPIVHFISGYFLYKFTLHLCWNQSRIYHTYLPVSSARLQSINSLWLFSNVHFGAGAIPLKEGSPCGLILSDLVPLSNIVVSFKASGGWWVGTGVCAHSNWNGDKSEQKHKQ